MSLPLPITHLAPTLLAAAAFTLTACKSSPDSGAGSSPKPIINDQAYTGPAVNLDSTGPRHLILLTAPTPGWTFTFDQVGPSGEDVFVTITRPDPDLLYPAVIVEQKLDSTVASGRPVRVFIRMVDFGGKAASQGYRLAKQSEK